MGARSAILAPIFPAAFFSHPTACGRAAETACADVAAVSVPVGRLTVPIRDLLGLPIGFVNI
jgi:hypothetical protein